jgi:O-succinylhomoserine sulfhydrylase
VAEFLEGHPKVVRAIYPGLKSHPHHAVAARQLEKGGTVVSFDLSGGQAAAFRFLNALEIIIISNNLGDAKSIITHPATTTHQRLTPDQRATLGITEGMVRLSLGIEDADDLIGDIAQALEAV